MPTAGKTWNDVLQDIDLDSLDENEMRDIANLFEKKDYSTYNRHDLRVVVKQQIEDYVPENQRNQMADFTSLPPREVKTQVMDTIPTEPPARKVESTVNVPWDKLRLILAALAIIAFIAIGAATWWDDKSGNAVQEVGNKVGFGFDAQDNLIVVPDGKLDKALEAMINEAFRMKCTGDVDARNKAANTSVDANQICGNLQIFPQKGN
jgi:hypothetical protein